MQYKFNSLKILSILPGFGKVDNAIKHYWDQIIFELHFKGIVSTYDTSRIKEVDVLFVNYSNYGFQKRGVPVFWVLKVICYSKFYKIKLHVFFHELYANSKNPLHSSYWLHVIQKFLCHTLFYASDCSYCSNSVMFSILKKIKSNTPLFNIGILSNIPSSHCVLDFHHRDNVAIVFGTSKQRELVYKNIVLLKKTCNSLGLKKIIDIGSKIDQNSILKFDFIEVDEMGVLKIEDISKLMGVSKFGFIHYDYHLLPKSGIFASYACNELAVINFNCDYNGTTDNLNINKEFVSAKTFDSFNKLDAALLARNLKEWYQNNISTKHFNVIFDSLKRF